MKKLLTIVAAALSFGAYAGQEDVPVVFDTSSVPVGTLVNVEANGQVVATTQTRGNLLFVQMPPTASYGLKLAGEAVYDVIDTDFTKATACPVGWTAKSYRDANPFNYNENGAVIPAWNQSSLQTTCSISPANAETTIDVVTFASGTNKNRNMVLALSSETYSVEIGNSYNGANDSRVRIGAYDGDASQKFASFQTNASFANPEEITDIATPEEIDVSKSLTYHLVIAGTSLTGAVSDGTTTKDISFKLPETYEFTTFNIDVDAAGGTAGIKSVTIKNDQEPPTVRTIEVADWTFESFTYEGESTELAETDIVRIPSTLADDDAQWQSQNICPKLDGHAIIIEKEMNWKASVDRMTINDVQIYLYQTQASKLVSGAVIDGTGTLRCSEDNIPVEGPATISCTIADAGSFKLAAGATLTVNEKLSDGRVTTDVANVRIAFNETTKTYSLVEQVVFSIPVIENAKAQYRYLSETAWTDATVTDGEYYKITVDKSVGFTFQYVALDGYSISGNQTGYKYTSGLTADTTYNNPKNDLKVQANISQEELDLLVSGISSRVLSLINGGESVTMLLPSGVTVTITGAPTLEGLPTSTAKTTIVGDSATKTLTLPTVEGATTAAFYKIEATTAK